MAVYDQITQSSVSATLHEERAQHQNKKCVQLEVSLEAHLASPEQPVVIAQRQ